MAKAKRKKARRAITPEDLRRLHFVGDPQVSPDGRRIVFVKKHIGESNEYNADLWIVPTSRGRPRRFTSGGKDGHPRWSPDGTRIAFVGEREKEKPQIHLIDADGGEAVPLTRFPEGKIRDFRWSPGGRLLAVVFREQDPDWTQKAAQAREKKKLSEPPRVLDDWWYRLDGDGYFNAQRYRLYLVDTDTGDHRCIFKKDTLGFFGYDFSPDARQLVIASNTHKKAMIREEKDALFRFDIHKNRLSRIPLPDGAKAEPRWSPDGRLIAYAGRLGKDGTYSVENLELFVCDPRKGRPRSLTAGEDCCLLSVAISDASEVEFNPKLQWSADSRRVFASIGTRGETHVASVALGGGRLRFHTSGAAAHDMGGLSADGKKMGLVIGSATKPGEIHVASVGAGAFKPKPLTDFNAALLAEVEVARPRVHWVRSGGGTKVHVWSLEPPGRKRKVPAVIQVHGGPHAMYGVGFFHEFQVLAAAGYAVFYSNPRGSKGYGRDHCAAIRGNWGGPDWEDVQAVTRFVQNRPYVDAKRIGIMGGSYGGYMTNWAIGHSRAYRAAITDRCVSNLVSMFTNSDFVSAPDRYWKGNPWDRPEELWRQSPLKYLGNARTPTLIIHSEGDLRCNVEQAEETFGALKLNNVSTRLVRYPRNTSHGMSRDGPPDMRLHRLHQILDWWKKHLR